MLVVWCYVQVCKRGEICSSCIYYVMTNFGHCCNGQKLSNCWWHYDTKLTMDYEVMISLLTFTSLDMNDNS